MSNVIDFPKIKRPNRMDDLVMKNQEVFCAEEDIEGTMIWLNRILQDAGYDMLTDDCIPIAIFLEDSLRAVVYHCLGLEHPLHEVAVGLYEEATSNDNEEQES